MLTGLSGEVCPLLQGSDSTRRASSRGVPFHVAIGVPFLVAISTPDDRHAGSTGCPSGTSPVSKRRAWIRDRSTNPSRRLGSRGRAGDRSDARGGPSAAGFEGPVDSLLQ